MPDRATLPVRMLTMPRESPTMNSDAHFLPLYRCHKIVQAAEIAEVEYGAAPVIRFLDDRLFDIHVDNRMFSRYKPTTGDFFVIYEDGYQSISPRQAFKEGYRPLDANSPIWPFYDVPTLKTYSPVTWAILGAVSMLLWQMIVFGISRLF